MTIPLRCFGFALMILLGSGLVFASPLYGQTEPEPVNLGKRKTASTTWVPQTDTGTATISPMPAEDQAFAPRIFEPDPKRAGMYSALFPGLGQAYNRQYWKLPVVAAGLGVAAYFIDFNTRQYQRYRKAYVSRLDQIPENDLEPQYDREGLRQIQEGYRKNRDITILLTGVGYAVQIMDAVTSAHLRNFDMSEDLSLRIAPVLLPEGPGLGLVFHWN